MLKVTPPSRPRRRQHLATARCPIARGLDRVGDGWSMLILRDVLRGLTRFDALQASLGIAPNILARRLTALVAAGLLERHPYSDHPPRADYLPTALGRDFRPVLRALFAWGDRHFAAPSTDAASGQPHAIQS